VPLSQGARERVVVRGIWGSKKKSIKARMLAIALIPSLVLLAVGLGISGYLVNQGIHTNRQADDQRAAVGPGTSIIGNLQLERWLSLVKVGGGAVDPKQLAAQRNKVNVDVLGIKTGATSMSAITDVAPSANVSTNSPWNQLPTVRQQIDSSRISLVNAYNYYDELLGPIAGYVGAVAGQAPNAAVTNAQLTAADIYSAAEDVARANALSFSAAIRGGMNGSEFAEYARQVGAYQSALASVVPRMTPREQGQYAAMIASPAWRQLTSVQQALSAAGPRVPGQSSAVPLAVSQVDWQNDTIHVMAQMLGLFNSHFQYAADLAASNGKATLISALIAGLVIVLAGIAVLIVALRMSNGVVRRLTRLRKDTLDMAEQQLPQMVRQLQAGEHVSAPEMPALSHGQDEIGQVADAFNKAQHTAVAAAVQEAQTRQGANTVFLNIAHRSQLVAQRQLSVLDLAERRQEDPQQVQFLFQLDHLATKARRNAENLIILGGKRPARQWRDAIPIRDVVRSAIGETEHFARVKIQRLPEISITGPAVGDLVHLLAELLDNATAFAPPEARAEVSGNMVGRGAVLEIEDQGLGIPPGTRDALNANLHTPPDYGVMALTSDSRLGLFVVARLAARHGIRVSLTDSIYGGTRAVVLLPAALLENADDRLEPLEIDSVLDESADVDTRLVPVWPKAEPAEDRGGPSTEQFAPVLASANGHNGNGHNGNGHSNGRNGNGNGHSNGNAAVDPPPLPHRQRQAHLAPQLASTPEPRQNDSAERVRDAITAFQRGTRSGRDES
jgi:signal transduction histidine kinase